MQHIFIFCVVSLCSSLLSSLQSLSEFFENFSAIIRKLLSLWRIHYSLTISCSYTLFWSTHLWPKMRYVNSDSFVSVFCLSYIALLQFRSSYFAMFSENLLKTAAWKSITTLKCMVYSIEGPWLWVQEQDPTPYWPITPSFILILTALVWVVGLALTSLLENAGLYCNDSFLLLYRRKFHYVSIEEILATLAVLFTYCFFVWDSQAMEALSTKGTDCSSEKTSKRNSTKE